MKKNPSQGAQINMLLESSELPTGGIRGQAETPGQSGPFSFWTQSGSCKVLSGEWKASGPEGGRSTDPDLDLDSVFSVISQVPKGKLLTSGLFLHWPCGIMFEASEVVFVRLLVKMRSRPCGARQEGLKQTTELAGAWIG